MDVPDVLHLGISAQVTFHTAALAVPGGPLPRSTGTCPLRWDDGGAIVAPLPADAAVWLSLRSLEPVALEVFVDGVNAVTGRAANGSSLPEQPHVVLPDQRWLDGVRRAEGIAEQIVGPPDGEVRTIELIARRLRGAAFRTWWVRSGEVRRANRFGDPEMVMGGGAPEPAHQVAQRIEPDPHAADDWDPEPFDRVEVHLVSPARWEAPVDATKPPQ